MDSSVQIYIGNIVHCNKPFTVHTFEKGFLAVKDGKILAVDNLSTLGHYKADLHLHETKEIILKNSQILIPGLIDTHIHASQYPNIGLGLDKPLLEWLNDYTFPVEKNFKEPKYAKKVYEAIVKRTLSCGTTTATYFATLYPETSLLLADAAIDFGQRAFVGKVNMTRFSPADYLETSTECIQNTKKFVEDVLDKKSPLVKPIITPRFALSLGMDEMQQLADLAKEFDLLVQSHISENLEEIAMVKKIFKKEYAEVYDEANLLNQRTILAHAVHLKPSEKKLLEERGVSISHCPSSNINLRSGLCDVPELVNAGINVALGTDVAGGSSVSIIEAMRLAITTSFAKSDKPFNCYDVFYLATLGGAKALSLDASIGNFEVGKDFDALVVDLNVEDSSADYLHECTPLQLLQKFIYVGDDRNVTSVFVAGKQVK